MRQETCGSSLWIVRQHTLITKITLGMTAPKNKIRPMLMREISWIGECELDEAGGGWRQLIGPMQELRSDICIFIISPARGGRQEKSEVKKYSKEVETNRVRTKVCSLYLNIVQQQGLGLFLKCRLIKTPCEEVHYHRGDGSGRRTVLSILR